MPEPIRPRPIRATRGLDMTSFHHVELLEARSLTVRPRPGTFSSRSTKPSLASRLAVEDVPEELVAHLDVDDGEVLGHGRVQAGHDDVVVVHLAGVRDDGDAVGLGQGGDLARLGEAADAVRVELDVVDGARLQQLAEAVAG